MSKLTKLTGIGVVGGGMISQLCHIANFSDIAGCRVVALAEMRPDLGRMVADKFGIPSLYPSHREMLADPHVDAVIVVTRRHATGPIVLDALNAGRHVLSEKPMAHTVDQAQTLVAAQSPETVYSIGMMKLHDPGMQRAHALLRRLVSSHEIGRPTLVRCFWHGGILGNASGDFVMSPEVRPDGLNLWPIAPDWLPAEMHTDYADFLNVQIHMISALRSLFGTLPAVRAVDFSHRSAQTVTFDFGDFPGIFEIAPRTALPWHEGIDILFERGALHIRFPAPLVRDQPAAVWVDGLGDGERTVFHDPPSWAFRRQAEAFVADVTNHGEPLANARGCVEDVRLAESIWKKWCGINGYV